MLPPNIKQRSSDPELMDAEDCDKMLLHKTLVQFERINRFITPSRRLMRKHFLSRMQQSPDREWTLLDIGAGGGDLALWLAQEARRRSLNLKITCLDLDRFTSNFASERCQDWGEIETVCGDMFEYCPERKWDFVYSNHVLHHLDWDQLKQAISLVDCISVEHFALVDLHRNHLSYYGYTLLAAVFLRGSFAFHDGRVSIRKAFFRSELQQIVQSEQWKDIEVQLSPPGHLVVQRTSGHNHKTS
ncbi:MAG: methyltransferase domain-containing protein [Pirellulaceae bacterium]